LKTSLIFVLMSIKILFAFKSWLSISAIFCRFWTLFFTASIIYYSVLSLKFLASSSSSSLIFKTSSKSFWIFSSSS
jgi:hypothetical protein